MNFLQRIPHYTTIQPRVKSWFNPQTLVPQKLRGLVMEVIITLTIAEVCAYKLIKQNIIAGELNMFTTDFIIITISLLEAILGPIVSWYGYYRRRMMMLAWNVGLITVCLLWFAMPGMTNREESEYCHADNFIFKGITVTPKAAIRLCLILLSCVMFSLARVAIWCHGIAYIDEHAPARTGMHFGILVTARVLPLLAGDKILTPGVENNLTMQIIGLVVGTLFNILQIFLYVPKVSPHKEENLNHSNRGFFVSLSRIFGNIFVMSQMVAIGLLAAALWGFAFHEGEIVKVIYHIDFRDNSVANLLQTLRYLVIIMAVLYVGVKFSAPILEEFCRFRGIKQATIMGIIALVFYILLLTMGKCEKGRVAGLQDNHYNYPSCSLSCGCIPRWREFDPVCVVDQVTTYLSPCQAGCASSELVDNIRVYTNCTCAPGNGRAGQGACSIENCYESFQLHLTFFVIVVTATVLAFQAQGMLILRAVDARDKSLALGVASAVVSMLTFVCGHGIFMGISAATCRWFEGARCHLQNPMFPVYVGSFSAVMVSLSICINISTWIYWKVVEWRRKKSNKPTRPEEWNLKEY